MSINNFEEYWKTEKLSQSDSLLIKEVAERAFDGGIQSSMVDIKRYRAALEYIALLANKKDPHLGHPRLTDKSCIFCMAFFALNNGAYGYTVEEEDYLKWIDEAGGKVE